MDDQSLGKMKNHGDTEDTEEVEISLAGRLRPGKNASRLRRKALNLLGDFLFYSTLNHEKIV
jgi:hypothetical protein